MQVILGCVGVMFDQFEFIVFVGIYFVMGDNCMVNGLEDLCMFGLVLLWDIVGCVVVVVWLVMCKSNLKYDCVVEMVGEFLGENELNWCVLNCLFGFSVVLVLMMF